jgi:hypothetical protein
MRRCEDAWCVVRQAVSMFSHKKYTDFTKSHQVKVNILEMLDAPRTTHYLYRSTSIYATSPSTQSLFFIHP